MQIGYALDPSLSVRNQPAERPFKIYIGSVDVVLIRGVF